MCQGTDLEMLLHSPGARGHFIALNRPQTVSKEHLLPCERTSERFATDCGLKGLAHLDDTERSD